MRTFIIIWLGQLVSTIGSRLTDFAIEIWVWENTGQATALSLIGFFYFLPNIFISLIAGAITDRWNRKLLMIVGDIGAVFATLIMVVLYLGGHLHIWQVYVIGTIKGSFSQLQGLSYSASIGLLVPKQQYTRASSMGFFSYYGSEMIAPALAGFLYYVIPFFGIAFIDFLTFLFAITTVLLVHIPQPILTETTPYNRLNIWQDMQFGWKHIKGYPSLLLLLVLSSLFWLFLSISDAIYSPLILARTGNNAQVLGYVLAAAGFGGVTSAVILSTWGGLRSRIDGVLLGMISTGLSKAIFGYGQVLWIWFPSQFCSSASITLRGSSNQAIWLSKVIPQMQGRVFATENMIQQMMGASAYLIAGPLADRIFEPAMSPGGYLAPIFGNFLGVNEGAGIALLFSSCAIAMLLVGICGYFLQPIREVELIVPDHNSVL
ncbi:MFS transporter [Chlorogloeopsis sp. ULAP01]|uniref:MFS transporter n=1 Tax=Chlorogloeopsis sp. ULAP01 TaxID=3056483 RepID=UPI0025AAE3B8|nr:MFS transporter [Chlorogloeopsis sp. ULAP01]MDM9384247.1 MFS transporter [Chlorogloeopsis sp. ULAP01]